MAKDINIGIGSETRAFQKGIKDGVIEPLEGAVDAIEELGKQGDDSGEQLTDAMKDAQKKTELLGDEYTQLQDKIRQIGKQGSDSFKKVKDGTDLASEGVGNLKEESVQTAREAAASFDGSAQSITDAFQEVAANAFIGFGPAGVAAGLAAAGAMGIVSKAIADAEEKATKAKEEVAALGSELIDAGGVGETSLGYVVDKLKEFATQTDDNEVSLKNIRKQSQDLGLDFKLVAQAFANGATNTDELVAGIRNIIEEDQALLDQTANAAGYYDDSVIDRIAANKKILDSLDEQKQKFADAAQQERDYLDTGAAAMEKRNELVDQINEAYDDAVGSVQDFINEESGLLDVQAYIDSMTARRDALNDYQKDLVESGLTPDQQSALNSMGIEAAAIWIKGYKSATPEQKKAMAGFLTESATDSSGQARNVIEKTFKDPIEASVKAKADTEQAETDLRNLIKARTAIIKVDFVNKYGKSVDG